MPAPMTPNLTAAKQAEIVQLLNVFFTASQVEALLKVVDGLDLSEVNATLEDFETRIADLEAAAV